MPETDDVQDGNPSLLLGTAEGKRLARADIDGWRRWGPYLSERQWGTVREDDSPDGTAWAYLTHDHARSRAYRWGEDGIAGFGDDRLQWCVSLAFWNGRDPILKERLFGLTNAEGNHGEDVKELYYYLDGTPTHSYMRMLYKYPQTAFPYERLVRENRDRGSDQPEFEIIDTGVFDDGRYFDVTVEYAKAGPDDLLMRTTVRNLAPEPSPLHVLPQLWARNTWSWDAGTDRPRLSAAADGSVNAEHPDHNAMRLLVRGPTRATWLFCENETSTRRLFGTDATGPFKDGLNDYVVSGDLDAVSLRGGTKCAAHHSLTVRGLGEVVIDLRLCLARETAAPFKDFDAVFAARRQECDAYYAAVQRDQPDLDSRLVQRQALAGMLWSKQFYCLDARTWLDGDPAQPAPPSQRRHGRNADWQHLSNREILSMPDKWEYPWYASWNLAFHCVTLALIDPVSAKGQLLLLTEGRYAHPNGQLPAYEWNFGDVNPPAHAWAAFRVFEMDRLSTDRPDHDFLERVLHKLMLNFGWWVNRKDAGGRNIFQGGFLGLDNIGVFDRSAPLPTGGTIDQSDAIAWMAVYSLNLMRIALELGLTNSAYENVASKFFEHFLLIACAMSDRGGEGINLWDEADQFYYDVLSLPNGTVLPMRVRSLVGLIPLLAVHVMEPTIYAKLPRFTTHARELLRRRPALAGLISRWEEPGLGARPLLALLRGHRMKQTLRRMLDEAEFLSDYGVRSVSRVHERQPFALEHEGQRHEVKYLPGESDSRVFGGNSNWRGPIWFPVNYLIIEALHELHRYYGPSFKVECPTGGGKLLSLEQIAK